MSAVTVRGLRRAFGSHVVLERLDLTIADSEFVALVGRSGGGKTTLLRTLAGLDPVTEGSIEVPALRSVVFQEPRLLPWRRVWQNVSLGLPRSRRRDEATRALAEVGLADHAQAWPLTLSGGEAQRVALARALVREPELLLLDEPFGALDALTRIHMHHLVRQLHERHRPAVLLVTHDVDEALELADRVIVLRDGRLDEQVETRELFDDRRDPRFEQARARLLGLLGVADTSAADTSAADTSAAESQPVGGQ
ncbi:ABC transporter ATP-binding protein [Frankia sp. QA3]|uniref:ABC transporter ATP-binding protein n=1 Tax=Frankia sp. QA3 TaxID=710111 RepID=UPI000269BCA8|nr:ABC transporter ATP-binding protein [Frankia sp. QA3]EIV91774.1 ABC-type nitrate/sulfonate/bicarbonate transport system, ATPase component [Frankia sp. QA3]